MHAVRGRGPLGFPTLEQGFPGVCVCVFVGSYTLILSVRTEYQNTHSTSSEDVWLVLTTSEACLRLSFKVGVKVRVGVTVGS